MTMLRSTFLLLLLWPLLAGADEPLATPVARKQFRQSSVYPYVFQPDCYLATTGPAPLRFAPAAPACAQRSAPPLLAAAQGKEKVAPALPVTAPVEPVHPNAAYQPPAEAPRVEGEAAADAVDFKRTPEEVLEFFRNNDGKAGKRIYLFDPIFQPAKPHELPKSKATYTQKP